MIDCDCDEVRDVLPSFVRGELPPHEAAAVDAHLAGCAECRSEEDLVRLIQDTLAPVPRGLESRVLTAMHAPRVSRWSPARVAALAATFAAAVLGGSLVFERGTGGDADTSEAHALTWAAAEDPLLHGRSALQQLSVEELESLLAELDR